MLGNALLERPETTLISAAIVTAGIPVYLWWRRRGADGGAAPPQ
jgi:hypothetical protein